MHDRKLHATKDDKSVKRPVTMYTKRRECVPVIKQELTLLFTQ
jgi:hypothetical protein